MSQSGMINSSGGGGGGTPIESVTGNDGVPVFPTANNINLIGQDGLTVFKSSTSTETITTRGVGINNMFLGQNAGNTSLSGGSNVGLGAGSLSSLTSGTGNVGVGVGSGAAITSGRSNVAIGSNALASNVASIENVAIGNNSLALATTGQNTAVGTATGSKLTTGFGLTALGWNALANATGSTNTAVGFSSGSDITSGFNNTLLGQATASFIRTGNTNLLLGSESGANYTSSESNNILLLSNGVAAESNVIRIGTQGSGTGQQNICFIAGIYNTVPSGTTQNVVINSNGQLGTGGSGTDYKYTATAISYQVLVTDEIIGVTSTAAPITIMMPNSGMVAGQEWTIKDESGGAAANNITISGNGANIDGASTFVINNNYGAVDIYYNGSNYFIV